MRVAILALLFVPATVHAVTIVPKVTLLPDFTVVAATWPPYGFAKNCSPGETAIVFHLTIHNIGQGASTAINDYHAVWVQDNANASWGGGAMLPAIASWGTATVDVGLVGLKSQDAMAGHHQFTATVNGSRSVAESSYTNDTLLIDVDFPPAFCGPVVATTTASSVTVTPRSTTPPRGSNAPPPIFAKIPAPTNLNNTITPAVCAKYGGPAASLACTAALPAGKLVLVWDYPSDTTVDGFRVYNHGNNQLVTIQTTPGVRLAILDPSAVGTCFVVTAFRGKNESDPSPTSFCVSAGNLAKTATFNSDYNTMIMDVYVDPSKSALDYSTMNPVIRSFVDNLGVGSGRAVTSWRDDAHTQPAQYTNSVYRGYAHFNASSLSGHQVLKATLQLRGGSTDGAPGIACGTQYGAAGSWKPGQVLQIAGPHLGGSRRQGPDVDLDVTSVVQSWASSQGSNSAFALTDDTGVTSYDIAKISSTCVTHYKTATLQVTYY